MTTQNTAQKFNKYKNQISYEVFVDGHSEGWSSFKVKTRDSNFFNILDELIRSKYDGEDQIKKINHAGKTISLNY